MLIRLKRITLTLLIIMLPLLLRADDPGSPCLDYDPLDNNCPLDTWVWAAFAVMLVFTVYRLIKPKQPVS